MAPSGSSASGARLFDDIARSTSRRSFWWLGQHSFAMRLGATVLLVDPFLSPVPGRLMPPPFAPEDVHGVDAVACTHDHLDHLDPIAVEGLAAHTSCTFVAPRAHERRMQSLGVPSERLVLLNDAESGVVGDVRVHAIKAAHEGFDRTPDGLYPHLGFVYEADDATVYHAGDTVWWEGLQARLRAWRLDVAMVPINGRDAERLADGVIGNMVYQEAADLVGQLGVALAVPAHHGMFESNTADPRDFEAYVRSRYAATEVWVGPPGVDVPFAARRARDGTAVERNATPDAGIDGRTQR